MQPRAITIVVPTYNRPRDLSRLLFFLDDLGCKSPVMLLDGSNESLRADNARIAARYGNASIHYYGPALHLGLRLYDGLRQVDTEYCVMCGDDDFVFPHALERCVDFLQSHSGFSAAIGWTKSLTYSTRGLLKRGFALQGELEHGCDIDHPMFAHRLLNYFAYTAIGSIPLFYGVRRTSEVSKSFSLVTSSMKYSSMELLTNMQLLLAGKVKILPLVFSTRNYSSEPTRDPEREGAGSYFTEADLSYVRDVMMDKLVREQRFEENVAKYTLDLRLTEHKSRMDALPVSPAKARALAMLQRLQRLGSILCPNTTADFLGVDRTSYAALRRAHVKHLSSG